MCAYIVAMRSFLAPGRGSAGALLAFAILVAPLAALATGCEASSTSGGASTRKSEPPSVATTIRPQITWPAQGTVDRTALEALPSEARRVVPTSPVPVLVPTRFTLTDVVLMVDEEYYALSAKMESRRQHSRPGHARALQVRGHRAGAREDARSGGLLGHVTENEGIRVASWMEHETAYSVDLECRSPTDAPCQNDKLVLEIANSLVHVGGRFAMKLSLLFASFAGFAVASSLSGVASAQFTHDPPGKLVAGIRIGTRRHEGLRARNTVPHGGRARLRELPGVGRRWEPGAFGGPVRQAEFLRIRGTRITASRAATTCRSARPAWATRETCAPRAPRS